LEKDGSDRSDSILHYTELNATQIASNRQQSQTVVPSGESNHIAIYFSQFATLAQLVTSLVTSTKLTNAGSG